MSFNVNKARKQRIEARGSDKFEFDVDGEVFTIDYEVKRETANALKDLTNTDTILRVLLGEAQYNRLPEDLSIQDQKAVLEAYNEESGLAPGESKASTSS